MRRKEKLITKIKNYATTAFFVGVMLFWVQGYTSASALKFAQISDNHFLANGHNTTFKMIAEAPRLLDDAIEQINETPNIDFVMFTGDLIDKPFEKELQAIIPHLEKLNYPWYFAFGNHDVCVGGYLTKSLYLSILRKHNSNFTFEKPYYSFNPKKGFKVIVLDSIIDTEITSQGHIYEEEFKWLEEELTNVKNEFVMIFMHMPVIEPYNSPNHRLRNESDIQTLIENQKYPIGVFTGHYHAAKVIQKDNVLYVNSPALISYPNAFRIINVTKNRNKVTIDLNYKETRLSNVQKLAKIMVFASTLYRGEEQDRNWTYVLKK